MCRWAHPSSRVNRYCPATRASLLSHIEASELPAVCEFSPPIGAPCRTPLAVAVAVTRGVEVRLEVHAGVRHANLIWPIDPYIDTGLKIEALLRTHQFQ